MEKATGLGNPTEVAFTSFGLKSKIKIIYPSEKSSCNRSAHFLNRAKTNGNTSSVGTRKKILYVKGAPEVLLEKSTQVLKR